MAPQARWQFLFDYAWRQMRETEAPDCRFKDTWEKITHYKMHQALIYFRVDFTCVLRLDPGSRFQMAGRDWPSFFCFQVHLERETTSRFSYRKWSPSPTNCLWGSHRRERGKIIVFVSFFQRCPTYLCSLTRWNVSSCKFLYFPYLFNIPESLWHLFLTFVNHSITRRILHAAAPC